jgi:hypothetical protein
LTGGVAPECFARCRSRKESIRPSRIVIMVFPSVFLDFLSFSLLMQEKRKLSPTHNDYGTRSRRRVSEASGIRIKKKKKRRTNFVTNDKAHWQIKPLRETGKMPDDLHQMDGTRSVSRGEGFATGRNWIFLASPLGSR